jgi:hypothetical protein
MQMRRIATMAVLATIAFGALAGTAAAQESDAHPEPLRLACRAVSTAAVACEWSPSHSREFAAYRLGRYDDDNGRVTVFRTNRRFVTAAGDRPVRPGRYLYWVAAYDRVGRVVGLSGPVLVVVEPAVRGG